MSDAAAAEMTVPRTTRYESLDIWRGLACLLVVVYHATFVYVAANEGPGPHSALQRLVMATHVFNVGVAMFFVISGYCIAAAVESAIRRNDSVPNYFYRRLRRIYPPLWAATVLAIALFFLLDMGLTGDLLSRQPWGQLRPWWFSAPQWFGNITLTETWRFHIAGGPKGHFPGQAWTLGYEEQFYLVMGLTLALARRRFWSGLAAVTVATLALSAAATRAHIDVSGWFFDGSWLLFAAGTLVYYRIHRATGVTRGAIDVALAASVVAPPLLGVAMPIAGTPAGLAFAAVLPFLHRFDYAIWRMWFLRPVDRCGQMCYSLYLVHQLPVKAVSTLLFALGLTGPLQTVLITVPVSLAVAVPLGWSFHRLVERRFMNTMPGARKR